MNDSGVFPFDQKTIAFLDRQRSQIEALQNGMQGALQYIIDINGLEGRWTIDWPGKCLVRADQPEQQLAPAPPADIEVAATHVNGNR